jgi:hypothetical protein
LSTTLQEKIDQIKQKLQENQLSLLQWQATKENTGREVAEFQDKVAKENEQIKQHKIQFPKTPADNSNLLRYQQELDAKLVEDKDADRNIDAYSADIASEKDQIADFETQIALENIQSMSINLYEECNKYADAHDRAAELWGNMHLILGTMATVISAVIGAGIFAKSTDLVTAAGILSLILVVLTALSTFLNSEQRSAAHFKAKTDFAVLSHDVKAYVDIYVRVKHEKLDQLILKVEGFDARMDDLLQKTPRLSRYYFKLRF